MHPRNENADGYDLAVLTATSAALAKHIKTTPAGTPSIDFANPAAVKALNRALLMHHYGVKGWDIPAGYLCPPIPGRADYIHALADLLADGNAIPTGPGVRGLDIGTGANLVYPLIGHAAYGWSFLGTDIDEAALANAAAILAKNPEIAADVELRHQPVWDNIFTGLLRSGENFDFTMCNPPFHASPDEVLAVSQRKWNNLGKPGARQGSTQARLNFGGGGTELWCNGGERGFVKTMIEQSKQIPKRALWFTTLLSKADNLTPIQAVLKKARVVDTRIIDMAQGQKQSRIVAWSFLSAGERSKWARERAKNPA
ncbi:23S rRNA (adenine(1618)-N(6))-methyltransferase RlmF [uncultured Dechloromonas sp.]|uniref:23S rRNA (adenine(1618)-N(6))-methyltransferase RlmF n=1 Tax=uncultured Dechloromonas sp. TaxID=171719 RepID=UPI0025D6E2A5|nr:23S rRNA (adenine(1618)-N(6))-methyltransferase RlmF [uncultured Dechloromonas sp.]